jgi:hypothetical protein
VSETINPRHCRLGRTQRSYSSVGELYRIVVVYDQKAVEGLTEDDMVRGDLRAIRHRSAVSTNKPKMWIGESVQKCTDVYDHFFYHARINAESR